MQTQEIINQSFSVDIFDGRELLDSVMNITLKLEPMGDDS